MELIELIKMLFKSKPSDFSEPVLYEMKHYPFSGYKYMMWCGRMIYRSSKKDKIMSEIGTERFKTSKRHESFHLMQAKIHGKNSWIRYYWKYFCEWIKGNPIINPSSSAYYTIPFEVEAYALEDKQSALDKYDASLLKSKYTFKKRKKLYKSKVNWKAFIKSL